MVAIAITIAIILVASTVILLTSHHLRVATISEEEVSSIAGQTLFEQKGNNSTVYSEYMPAVRMDVRYFNESNNTGFVLVDSVEFNNLSQSRYFQDYSFSIWPNLVHYNFTTNWNNGSYNGFNFSSVLFQRGNLYTFLASGYSGPFAFYIYDSGIKLSGTTTLIQDEIEAMSS